MKNVKTCMKEITGRERACSCVIFIQVCGREEYLFGRKPLIQFLYIQETLYTCGVPQVMIVSLDMLPLSEYHP